MPKMAILIILCFLSRPARTERPPDRPPDRTGRDGQGRAGYVRAGNLQSAVGNLKTGLLNVNP